MREIAGDAEDDEGAGGGLLLRHVTVHHRLSDLTVLRRVCHGLACGGSWWPPKSCAHRREQLFGKGVVLARAEARVQRRGQHLGRHGLVDRGIHGPAAFAGILDEAGIIIERMVFRER